MHTDSALPLVSVVTVCRNAAADLMHTAQSVLALSYPAVEYIIVDGASTDETRQLLPQLEQQFAAAGRHCAWSSAPDAGIYDAMNKGAARCTGTWICFMNAGDSFAAPDVLQRLLAAPIAADCGVVYGNVILRKAFGMIEMKPKSLEYLEKKMAFCHQATLVRTTLAQARPFDLRFRIAADFNFFHQYFRAGGRFHYCDVAVAIFEAEAGTSSQQKMALRREYARIRGIEDSWAWRFSLVGQYLGLAFKRMVHALVPASLRNRWREKNYRRLAQRRPNTR